jgi:aromatic ring hydroxylase
MTDHRGDDSGEKTHKFHLISSSQRDLESSVSAITAISWKLKKKRIIIKDSDFFATIQFAFLYTEIQYRTYRPGNSREQ